ncbi:cation:proton antiporter [Candidatus Gottesmanbacteria bacterium]|nr:cation:proton antiporter [Candidatus Gottesmanbacteria bacterium]
MSDFIFARNLVIVLLTAFVGGVIAKRFKLPILVGYLLGGVIFGNFISYYFAIAETIRSIAEIGVVLLLFTLGLEFSLTKLKDLGEVVIFGSLIQVLLTIIVFIIIFPLMGIDFYTALFLGCVFSLSSTAVALKTLSDKGELETLHGEIASGWLFMQDLYTLPLIIILPTVGLILKGEGSGIGNIFLFSKSIFFAFTSFMLVIFLGKKTLPFILEKIADLKSRELLLLAAVVFCLVFAYLFQFLGLSFPLGAFVAGIILSSSSTHHGIFAEVRPLRDLFSSVFFVSLGFILNPLFIFSQGMNILGLVVVVVLLKFIISAALVFLLGYHPKTAVLSGFSLISVGEFAFIIAVLGLTSRLIDDKVYMTILSVSFISLIISVPILTVSDKIYYRLNQIFKKRFRFLTNFLSKFHPASQISDIDLSNHVVVLGHGRVGKYICRALSIVQIPYVVVDYNHKLVKSLRLSGVNVIYGDPAEIDVLEFTKIKQAKAVILAYADRHTQETVVLNVLSLNPNIRIICRTHFDEDQKKLKSLGVDSVVQPEFEAAVSMTKELLHLLFFDTTVIENKLRSLRVYQGLD